MIDRAVDKLAELHNLLWKPLFWLLVIVDVVWFFFLFTNNSFIFYGLIIFICLQIILSDILSKRKKRESVESFIPGKPEKDGIRYLRGKRAREYESAWEATDTYLEIGGFKKFFYGIRYQFYRLAGLRIHYWIKRPWYDAKSRRALDMLSIHIYEHPEESNPPKINNFIDKIRYKQLKHKYRKDLKRKDYWIRGWGKTNRVFYIWHEDMELYKKLYFKKINKKH